MQFEYSFTATRTRPGAALAAPRAVSMRCRLFE